MATWFRRPAVHFDISLQMDFQSRWPLPPVLEHGKTGRPTVKLKHIRFDNRDAAISTTFDRDDFALVADGEIPRPPSVREFFAGAGDEFYDDQSLTAGQLLIFPAAKM